MLAYWLEMHVILLLAQLGPPGRRLVSGGQRAQSMVEYSIIAALVAIVAMVAVTTLGKDIEGVFLRIAGSVAGLGNGGP